jgi:hypothetical protein
VYRLRSGWTCCERVRLCACRKLRPHRSSGTSTLVEDSAEAVSPAYGETFDPVETEQLGLGSQRCRCGKRSMSAVPVAELLVSAQRVPEMGLVPTQPSVQQFTAQRLEVGHAGRGLAGAVRRQVQDDAVSQQHPTGEAALFTVAVAPARAVYLIAEGSRSGFRRAVQEATTRWGPRGSTFTPPVWDSSRTRSMEATDT